MNVNIVTKQYTIPILLLPTVTALNERFSQFSNAVHFLK